MDAIYDTIEGGYKVGLFESPTGTGKTLSIICAAMTWLRNHKKNSLFRSQDETNLSDDDSDEEWVKQDYQNRIVSTRKNTVVEFENQLTRAREDYVSGLQRVEHHHQKNPKRPKVAAKNESDDFLPVDYEKANDKLKEEIDRLLQLSSGKVEEDDDFKREPLKLFFSSRTHSQLNQFANQLRLTHFDSIVENLQERTKYTPLASRKQLCINDKVKRTARSDTAINDACVDLQRQKDSCEFFPKQDSQLAAQFADVSLSTIHDVEDLAELGSNLNVCPYYSSRRSIPNSEIVAVPYQMILEANTRRTLKLDIKDSVVIIDEAHNLIDAITSLNSVSISLLEVETVVESLKSYLSKFLKRLNSGNRINLMKLIRLCQAIVSVMKTPGRPGTPIGMEAFLREANADLFNIHKLESFLSATKIAYKIQFYLDKSTELAKGASSNPLLFKVIKFLKALNNTEKEGKFIWGEDEKAPSIEYMLLDPSAIFESIIDEARCVLLFGGTMEPTSDFSDYLFPTLSPDSIRKFSCGHLIPPENLKVFPVSKYKNQLLEFKYGKRDSPVLIRTLGQVLYDICEKTPKGVVVFFPSYSYLDKTLEEWKKCGLYTKLNALKQLFHEHTGSADDVLSEYKYSVENSNGAILLSVVGGKMSEGINFSDDLARAVVMVGLPYANASAPSIIAKKKFIEDTTLARGGSSKDAERNAQNYYKNLCMKAVNQSVGRSIRHIRDYSLIFLLDARYENPDIKNSLSRWVLERIDSKSTWDQVLEATQEFFITKAISKDL